MFPTTQQRAVHKRARTRQEKEDTQLNKRASEVTNPDELVDLILEITTMRYLKGMRKIKSSIGVPPENFVEWAERTDISSPELAPLYYKAVQREVIKKVLQKLRQLKHEGELGPNVFWVLNGGSASKQLLNFVVEISVIERR